MNDRLRVIRDQIGKGDDVLVFGHGPKPREARVVEVLRAAVRIRYDDAPSTLHTVMLKQVRRVEPAAPDPRASKPPSRKSQEPPPPDPPPAPVEEPRTDVDAWIEMGREVMSQIDAELEALDEQAAALASDMQCLRVAFDEIEDRKAALRARKARIDTVLK